MMGACRSPSGRRYQAGPVIGGAIAHGISWQWVFWVNVPVGIILVTLGQRYASQRTERARLGGFLIAGTRRRGSR